MLISASRQLRIVIENKILEQNFQFYIRPQGRQQHHLPLILSFHTDLYGCLRHLDCHNKSFFLIFYRHKLTWSPLHRFTNQQIYFFVGDKLPHSTHLSLNNCSLLFILASFSTHFQLRIEGHSCQGYIFLIKSSNMNILYNYKNLKITDLIKFINAVLIIKHQKCTTCTYLLMINVPYFLQNLC